MTKDEIMSLVNRSLFAVLGYTDEAGLPCVRRRTSERPKAVLVKKIYCCL